MNLFLCEIAAVPWLQLAFEIFLHWGLILLFIDVNWNCFSSNHFRREVRYCNEKEIHVEELTYLDFTWNLLYLVINIKKSVDNFVITKCGLTSICHFHELLFWNLKQLCRNSVKSLLYSSLVMSSEYLDKTISRKIRQNINQFLTWRLAQIIHS